MFEHFQKILAASGLSLALALGGVTASSTPAAADNENLHRFLGGAAALAIIAGIASSHRNHHSGYVVHQPSGLTPHYVAPPVTRHVIVPAQPRLVAPGFCFHRFNGPNLNLRGYRAGCLRSSLHASVVLPSACLEHVFTYQGWQEVYDAQCLRRHGFVRG